MKTTMLKQLFDQKARGLSHELEELQLIKTAKENGGSSKAKSPDKYKSPTSKQDTPSH